MASGSLGCLRQHPTAHSVVRLSNRGGRKEEGAAPTTGDSPAMWRGRGLSYGRPGRHRLLLTDTGQRPGHALPWEKVYLAPAEGSVLEACVWIDVDWDPVVRIKHYQLGDLRECVIEWAWMRFGLIEYIRSGCAWDWYEAPRGSACELSMRIDLNWWELLNWVCVKGWCDPHAEALSNLTKWLDLNQLTLPIEIEWGSGARLARKRYENRVDIRFALTLRGISFYPELIIIESHSKTRLKLTWSREKPILAWMNG